MCCCLQLSEGLSSEYIKRSDREGDEKAAKFNADRQIYSKYYVHQVLQQGEESLRDAWTKASQAAEFSAFTGTRGAKALGSSWPGPGLSKGRRGIGLCTSAELRLITPNLSRAPR